MTMDKDFAKKVLGVQGDFDSLDGMRKQSANRMLTMQAPLSELAKPNSTTEARMRAAHSLQTILPYTSALEAMAAAAAMVLNATKEEGRALCESLVAMIGTGNQEIASIANKEIDNLAARARGAIEPHQ